jgi:hypothetical protein
MVARGVILPVLPHLVFHVEHDRRRALGRILVCNDPARALGGGAEALLQREVIDADDHPIGRVVERAAGLLEGANGRDRLIDARAHACVGVGRHAQRVDLLDEAGVRVGERGVAALAAAVRAE